MPTKKTQPKNDVSRRLAGIKQLFNAAETKRTARAFGSGDGGPDVPLVPEVDVLEEIATFANVTNGVEAALTNAIHAFGGYSEAEFDGDVQGAAAELHADVRALTNVALGLSPPSRAFYNKVLGGLVEVENVAAPPGDAGPVPYPPLRVSIEEIEKQGAGWRGRGTNGHAVHAPPPPVPPAVPIPQAVYSVLIRLQRQVVATYFEKAAAPSAIAAALKPMVHSAKTELTKHNVEDEKIENLLHAFAAKSTYSGDPDADMAAIEARFREIYVALA